MMNIFEFLKGNNSNVVVKTLKGKYGKRKPISITVGNISDGYVYDTNGNKNEIVVFLRKDKKDRYQ